LRRSKAAKCIVEQLGEVFVNVGVDHVLLLV